MKKTIKNKGIKFGRKGIGVEELIGLNEKRIDNLSKKHPTIKKIIKKDFGKVRGWRREILRQRKSLDGVTKEMDKEVLRMKKEMDKMERQKDKYVLRQRKQISHHTNLLNKYLQKMEEGNSKYIKMINLFEPKVTLKRPTKSYPFWRGKVWWGVGRFKKRGWEEFHIISEKKRDKLGLSEYEVREIGVVKFRDKLIRNDLILD